MIDENRVENLLKYEQKPRRQTELSIKKRAKSLDCPMQKPSVPETLPPRTCSTSNICSNAKSASTKNISKMNWQPVTVEGKNGKI